MCSDSLKAKKLHLIPQSLELLQIIEICILSYPKSECKTFPAFEKILTIKKVDTFEIRKMFADIQKRVENVRMQIAPIGI